MRPCCAQASIKVGVSVMSVNLSLLMVSFLLRGQSYATGLEPLLISLVSGELTPSKGTDSELADAITSSSISLLSHALSLPATFKRQPQAGKEHLSVDRTSCRLLEIIIFW